MYGKHFLQHMTDPRTDLLFRALIASCICRYSAALHTSLTSSLPCTESVAVYVNSIRCRKAELLTPEMARDKGTISPVGLGGWRRGSKCSKLWRTSAHLDVLRPGHLPSISTSGSCVKSWKNLWKNWLHAANTALWARNWWPKWQRQKKPKMSQISRAITWWQGHITTTRP